MDQQMDVTVDVWIVSQPKTFLFLAHKVDCTVMDKVHCKARGLC
jgi:hypothetical protein